MIKMFSFGMKTKMLLIRIFWDTWNRVHSIQLVKFAKK